VFFAFDGQLAIAGQNEDWDDSNTQFWVVPRTPATHGVLYFGFGRGEYPKEGIAFSPRVREVLQGKLDQLNSLAPEDLYGIPQQGVNEEGLFFGGAQTDRGLRASYSVQMKLVAGAVTCPLATHVFRRSRHDLAAEPRGCAV
jgi:hypothetical protein